MIRTLWARFTLWLTKTEGIDVPECDPDDHANYLCDCDDEAVNYGDWPHHE